VPHALEVAAYQVIYGGPLNAQHGGVNERRLLMARSSRVAIRTARVRMYLPRQPADVPGAGPDHVVPTPEEALCGLMQLAPPAVRSCSLASVLPRDPTGRRSWRLELLVSDTSGNQQTSVYHSAAQLAEGLRACMAAAHVSLQLDEGRQEVVVTREEAAA